jgi:hypothetical protein
VERVQPEKREEWIAMLEAPLPGERPRTVTDATAEAEGAAFMTAMHSLTGN